MPLPAGVRLDRRTPTLRAYQEWVCQECRMSVQTEGILPNRYHDCKARGLTWPMQLRGVASKVVSQEREDRVGKEVVSYDRSGRPIMNVRVVQDQREDVAVFIPSARGSRMDSLGR